MTVLRMVPSMPQRLTEQLFDAALGELVVLYGYQGADDS